MINIGVFRGKIFNRLIKLSKCFLQISSQFPGSHRLMWTYAYYLPGSPWLLYKKIVQMDFVHHQQIRGEWKWRRRFLQSIELFICLVYARTYVQVIFEGSHPTLNLTQQKMSEIIQVNVTFDLSCQNPKTDQNTTKKKRFDDYDISRMLIYKNFLIAP